MLLRADADADANAHDEQHTPTTTPDGFDMTAAVQRQHRFSQSMHAARWLAFPAPLRRARLAAALARYAQFLALAAAHPGVGVAPAPDVDLAWHTHQLAPRRYAAWCRAQARVGGGGDCLVDHRDDLAPDVLARSAAGAARLWRARFGGADRVCLCRRCVGARFGMVGAEDGTGGSSSGSDGDVEDDHGVGCAAVCAEKKGGPAGDGDRCPSADCQAKCETACQTQCQTSCGTKCGYVCGACDAR